jgi:hypothetical protein
MKNVREIEEKKYSIKKRICRKGIFDYLEMDIWAGDNE